MVTLEPPSNTLHDFLESLLLSCLTEGALTNDELSLECLALKIDKHVIQNRSLRQQKKSWMNSRSNLIFLIL